MIEVPANPFFSAIEQLLTTNTLLLHGRVKEVSEADMPAVVKLLEERYAHEAIGYPGPPLAWDAAAAGWAVKVVFYAAQLLLYRSHETDALSHCFPNYHRPKTAASIVSADIILRFLPSILQQLEAISVEDPLIPVLKDILLEWHYTGLLTDLVPDTANLDPILRSETLTRLYVDRVIERHNKPLAMRAELHPSVRAALGNYTDVFWKDLKTTI